MLNIDDNNIIRLTRGDTAYVTINITCVSSDGEVEYELQPNDKLTLSVKRKVKDTEYVFSKDLVGANIFHIKPEDTNGVKFGSYIYDVQLTTTDGDIYTIIEPTTFEIKTEVTTP